MLIKEYLELETGDNPETKLKTVEDIKRVGYLHDFEVWQARLVFSDNEQRVWVIPEPVLYYYLHDGRRSNEESELATPEDAVLYHIGYLTTLRVKIRQVGSTPLSRSLEDWRKRLAARLFEW